MTLFRFYRASFFASLALAWLSVLLGANVPAFMWGVLALLVGTELLHATGRHAPAWAVTLIGFGSLAWGLAWLGLFGLGQVVMGAVITLSGILVARLSRRQTPSHDQQAIVLGLLLLLAGSVLHTSITYGLVFVAYAITTAWALVSRQLVSGCLSESERLSEDATQRAAIAARLMSRRDIASPRFIMGTALLAATLLASTSVAFALFPRIGLSNLSFLARPSPRFPPNVSLASGGRGGIGGPVMARVRGLNERQFDAGLYLRGPVYNIATAQGFERGSDRETLAPVFSQVTSNKGQQRYQVFMQPVLDSVMLSLGNVRRAWGLRGGQPNPNVEAGVLGVLGDSELHAGRNLSGPTSYEVLGSVVGTNQGAHPPALPPKRLAAMLERFTVVPELDPRVSQLASSIRQTMPDEPEAIAEATRAHLEKNFRYTLQPQNGLSDPLNTFLFDSRAGHCEFFATSLALLLRLNAIPARVVGGFQGGQWDAEDRVVVFNSGHAHAWVEWWSREKGWQIIDATPGSAGERHLSGLSLWQERLARWWDQNVVEFGAHQQIAALSAAATAIKSPYRRLPSFSQTPASVVWLAVVSILCVGVVTGFILWRRTNRLEPSALLSKYFKRRIGRGPLPHETFRQLQELSATESPRPPSEERAVTNAVATYEAVVFGDGSRDEHLAALDALKAETT